jgi:hypothetical protein
MRIPVRQSTVGRYWPKSREGGVAEHIGSFGTGRVRRHPSESKEHSLWAWEWGGLRVLDRILQHLSPSVTSRAVSAQTPRCARRPPYKTAISHRSSRTRARSPQRQQSQAQRQEQQGRPTSRFIVHQLQRCLNMDMRWFAYWMGLTNASGKPYLFWSGFGSDLTLFGGCLVFLRRHNCQINGCWRLSGHPTESGHYVCRRHNPDGKITIAHLRRKVADKLSPDDSTN